MAGALRATTDYVTKRKQFGKEISKFQLIQEKLAMMQGNLAQAMATCAQLARMQANGEYDRSSDLNCENDELIKIKRICSYGTWCTWR